MEVKNLYDPQVKTEIIERINRLTPGSKALWGKMTVSQMLAHVQAAMEVGLGVRTMPRSFLLGMFGPLVKKMLYSEKPFRRHLPTSPSFVIKEDKDFEKEKLQLLSLLANFSEANTGNQPHPIFGKMTKEQWSKSNWKHIDHHLQQFGV